VLLAIVGCEFMLQLDTTIVTVALPNLQTDLEVSAGSLSWVINAFGLAFGGVLLVGGRLGDVYGHRRVFLAGTALFAAGSALAGLAPTFWVLLVGRVLQGLGAAVAGPSGLALLALSFPGERQPRALAVYSTVTGLGASAGLIVGGVLAWVASWRWTLLVNAPVGLALVILAARFLPAPSRPGQAAFGPAGAAAADPAGAAPGQPATRARQLDLAGALTSVVAMTALVFGLVRAADQGWGDAVAWASLGLAAVLAVVFAAVETRAEKPMLPRRIVVHRARSFALLEAGLMAFVLVSFLFFSTQFLQHERGFGPLRTGLAYLPFGLALMVAARFVPRLLARVQAQELVAVGFALMAGGTFWLSRLDAHSGYLAGVFAPMVLLGAGAGVVVVPVNVFTLTTATPEDSGICSAAVQTALSVGGSLGLAVLLAVYVGTDGSLATAVAHTFRVSSAVAVGAVVVALVGRAVQPRATR
jgi:MFS family permease